MNRPKPRLIRVFKQKKKRFQSRNVIGFLILSSQYWPKPGYIIAAIQYVIQKPKCHY